MADKFLDLLRWRVGDFKEGARPYFLFRANSKGQLEQARSETGTPRRFRTREAAQRAADLMNEKRGQT